jgi:NAD(P)-dependent dehydrogenase (short-subunit alcohol dehydrogenase family)
MIKGTFTKIKKQIEDTVPLRRMGNTQDMVGVALFLSSNAGAWITGASIAVDGGVLILPSKF